MLSREPRLRTDVSGSPMLVALAGYARRDSKLAHRQLAWVVVRAARPARSANEFGGAPFCNWEILIRPVQFRCKMGLYETVCDGRSMVFKWSLFDGCINA